MTDDLTAAEVDALRRRVLNVVGHELRTPVSALAGLARQLGQGTDEQIRTEIGPALERLAGRVESLLSDLLLAAGVTTALPVQRLTTVDLGETAWAVWSSLGELTIGVEYRSTGDPVTAKVTDEAASRILRHLLLNAAHYGDGTVTVHTGLRNGHACIEIINSAAGLKPEELRLAKEALFRGELAVTRAPGIGVGLTVADALADDASGALELVLDDDTMIARLELPAT